MESLWRLVFLVSLLLLGLLSGTVSDDIGGSFVRNHTIILSGSPYNVTDEIIVGEEVTLTIEAGVRLLFPERVGMTVLGRLIAVSVKSVKGTPKRRRNLTGPSRNLAAGSRQAAAQYRHLSKIKTSRANPPYQPGAYQPGTRQDRPWAPPECKSRSAPYRISHGSRRRTDRASEGSLTETDRQKDQKLDQTIVEDMQKKRHTDHKCGRREDSVDGRDQHKPSRNQTQSSPVTTAAKSAVLGLDSTATAGDV
ncbi:hypothetical protein Bbelb_352480 [Branchiostoma belcheri]|nr:hypothetical protein Bbelb_352480 [Branchiostoma belcheri]